VVEGLVISSNPKSKAGGSLATCRVFQAGQIKRVRTTGREMSRRRNSDTVFPDIGSNDISDLKH
jgi:hypothetical protein